LNLTEKISTMTAEVITETIAAYIKAPAA